MLALLLGWLLYREQAKAKMTQELADLASRSLGDKSVQTKTAEVSMHTLATLLADERTRQRTLQWLQGVLEDPQTIGAVVHLVQQVRTSRAEAATARTRGLAHRTAAWPTGQRRVPRARPRAARRARRSSQTSRWWTRCRT